MAISHCYWHLVVKNGNFSLLLTSHDKEWQFHIATDIATEISTMRAYIFLVYYVILLLKLILAGHVCRWSAELSQIYPYNLSDEVTKIRCEMKYPDRLSDIHPPWTCQTKWQRWDVRWSTQIGCQIYHPVVTSHFSGLAIFTLLLTSSGQEWQIHIASDT